jgi:hypothetical protein
MTRTNTTNTSRASALGRASAAATICCAALALSSDGARAQQDPTTIGAGQRPFVMVIVDTSASMEFSQEGETRYACYDKDPGDLNADSCDESRSLAAFAPRGGDIDTVFEWSPTETLTESGDPADLTYNERDDEVRRFVGPCRTWVPRCNNYERPPWLPDASNKLMREGDNRNYYDDEIEEMRGTQAADGTFVKADSGRLTNFNQPRHVQVKELLTGDMVLRPEFAGPSADDRALSPSDYGPGCFFVPRMFGARSNRDAYRVCHDEELIDENDPLKGTRLVPDPPNTPFPDFVDHNDPRPHIQEVYDFQRRNGLLDNLANVAIFSVAMFDGYQDRDPFVTGGGWESEGTYKDGSVGDDVEVAEGYNLGIYKIVGPSIALHEIETTSLSPLSTFSQMAITDAGFLTLDDHQDFEVSGDNSNEIGLSFPPRFKDLVQPYFLGQQPIAKGTPLAAAIHDVHMFFKYGQHQFEKDGDLDTDTDKVAHPLKNDVFYQCRGKHVVMLTDGYPEPETGTGIGSERLGPAYQYNEPDKYPYKVAEEEIADFVAYANDPDYADAIENPKFQTRVHIVGLNTERGVQANEDDEAEIRLKMGKMAANGNTCAIYYLSQSPEGREYIPSTLDLDWNTAAEQGTCNVATDNCLVVQFADKSSAPDYDTGEDPTNSGTTETVKCQSPALILSRNDAAFDNTNIPEGDNREFRDDLAFALQIVFNEVIDASGGVASRTRASVTNSIALAGDRGQYRVYSGAEVSAGSIYWKGILNREPLVCSENAQSTLCTDLDNPAECIWPLHRDIALQVEQLADGSWVDNRRLFTALPDVGSDPYNPQSFETGNELFPTSYRLRNVSNSDSDNADKDTFGPTNLLNPANANFLVGKRIPFRLPDLTEATTRTGVPATDVPNYLFGANGEGEAQRVVDTVRGHVDEKRNQPLNAILNSNPVTVGPPSVDLPIASYRDFRDLYRNRAPMLYVSTLDGILHAIHVGEQNQSGDDDLRVFVREKSADKGDEVLERVVPNIASNPTTSQREAWGYVPHMILPDLFPNLERQPNLLDGTPVVKDVRLCDANPDRNFNEQACDVVSSDANANLSGAMQWRTVLVQGMGQAGSGYLAMDVTRTGGPVADASAAGGVLASDPDPIPLWEFDGSWEKRQLDRLQDTELLQIAGSLNLPAIFPAVLCSVVPILGFDCNDPNDFYRQPFLGLSTGDPAIGTVVLVDPVDNTKFQRAVTVFGAGRVSSEIPLRTNEVDEGRALRMGRAIYVVDLQTGSLLRRFTKYTSRDGATTNERGFEYEVSGTPTLFNDRVGSVTNRGFIGDAGGRLFRIDMSNIDPAAWSVELMYDPCRNPTLAQVAEDLNNARDESSRLDEGCGVPDSEEDYLEPPPRAVGPADFPPAVALDRSRRVVVTYGLGDRSDTTGAGKLQAVVAVAEEFETNSSNELVFRPTPNAERFAFAFENGEKLTGAPTIFNNGSYFTTYYTDPDDGCAPGTSRIYGLDFNEAGFADASATLTGKFDAEDDQFDDPSVLNSGESGSTGTYLWVGPKEPTLIRGLTIAFDVDCSGDPDGPAGTFSENGDPPQPTLIAQIGGAEPPPTIGKGSPGSGADGIARLEIKLDQAKSRALPLSWGVVGF